MTPEQIIKNVIKKEFEGQILGDLSSPINFVKRQHAYLLKKYNLSNIGFENTSEYDELYNCITGVVSQFVEQIGRSYQSGNL